MVVRFTKIAFHQEDLYKKGIFKRPPELKNETNTTWCFAFIVVSFRKLLTIMHVLTLKWTFQVQKV